MAISSCQMFLELLVVRFSSSLSRYLALPVLMACSASYLAFLYLSLSLALFRLKLVFNIIIEPRFVVGVACYCFSWYTEALAESDVITDCLGVLVNVGCGLFEHSPISAFKTAARCLHCIHCPLFHSFHGWLNTFQLLFVSRHQVNHGVVRAAEWCATDGTVRTLDGCVTMVKSSTIPSCTCHLLYELRHLFLWIGFIKITRHNNKRVWLRKFSLCDDVRQLNHGGICVSLGGIYTPVRIMLENFLGR